MPCKLWWLSKKKARHFFFLSLSSREEHQGTDDATVFMAPCPLWCGGLVEVKSACHEELHLQQTLTISLSSLLFWSGKEVAYREKKKKE